MKCHPDCKQPASLAVDGNASRREGRQVAGWTDVRNRTRRWTRGPEEPCVGALQPVGGAKGTGQRRAWARRTLHPVAVIARREQVRDTPLRCEPCARATMRCGNGRTPCVKCPGGQLILAFVPASSDKMPAWRLVSTPARARIGVSCGASAPPPPANRPATAPSSVELRQSDAGRWSCRSPFNGTTAAPQGNHCARSLPVTLVIPRRRTLR